MTRLLEQLPGLMWTRLLALSYSSSIKLGGLQPDIWESHSLTAAYIAVLSLKVLTEHAVICHIQRCIAQLVP